MGLSERRAQLTTFIIVGLVMVAVFALAIYVRVQTVETRVGSLQQQVDLQAERTTLKLMVDDCLRQKSIKAIELYGLNPDDETQHLITSFVEYEVVPCLDVQQFVNAGFGIQQGAGYAATTISEGAVEVKLHLPLTLRKGLASTVVEDFSFTLQKVRYINLPTDDSGVLQQAFTVTTPNGRAELTIPQGVAVRRSGAPVRPDDVLALRLVDRNYNGMQNAVSIGEVLYLMQSGVAFQPAATLTLFYEDDEIPPWENEEQLTLSVYNDERGIWETLPSIVDAERNKITAQVTHFSLFSVTSSLCRFDVETEQVIASGLVYKERCRPCSAPTQAKGAGLYFTGTGPRDYPTPVLGTPNGPCVQRDWDGDDPDGDGKKERTRKMDELDCVIGEEGDYNYATGECTYEVDATPETYGYDDARYVGGTATWTFQVAKDGNACEASESVSGPVDFTVIASPGDTVSATLNGVSVLQAGGPVASKAQLRQGTNTMTFAVENANGDACAEAQTEITVHGAGFLPSCSTGGQLSGNCQCDQQNVNIQGKKLFCCPNGVIVENSSAKCQPGYVDPLTNATNICGSEFLSAADHGCYCGSAGQQYNHYGAAKHYCCGLDGLSKTPCEQCRKDGGNASDGCLCGGFQAKAGQVCCHAGGSTYLPLDKEDCPAENQSCPSGSSGLVSAVIGVTGGVIEASEVCGAQPVGWWEDTWRNFAYSWCKPPTECDGEAVCSATLNLGCFVAFGVLTGDAVNGLAEFSRCRSGGAEVGDCVDWVIEKYQQPQG